VTTPPRYVLDTQFYIDVLRGTPAGAAVVQFLAARVAVVDLHALVGAELLAGAVSAAQATGIRQRLMERFKPARLLVPDATDLLAAGDAIRLLRSRNGDHPEHAQRNVWNDVIIAVSCRRRGRVLISRDQDHARIAAVVRHHVLTALPT
jgi:predicted nucleic acid-binding protein